MDNCSHNHVCKCQCSSLSQTLDELDFERGIWYAAQSGDEERVNKLLVKGTSADSKDTAGYTALHYAARNGHVNICKILLQNGCDINAATRAGQATALHRACSAGKLNVVKLLLQYKAEGKIKDNDGKCALHRAAESQNAEVYDAVLRAFPDLKKDVDNKGKLPIDYINEKISN